LTNVQYTAAKAKSKKKEEAEKNIRIINQGEGMMRGKSSRKVLEEMNMQKKRIHRP